jgi:hypothetical protein
MDYLMNTARGAEGINIRPVTDSTMPSGSPTEPAGAFKSSGGTGTPGKPPETKIPDFTDVYGTPPEQRIWPERAFHALLDSVLAPGEAAQGKLPQWAVDSNGEYHTSTQMIEKTNDLAMLAVTGPAPVATKLADGTLGSFMGVRSKTFNKNKLAESQVMEANAVHPDDIWDKTGSFRGADNRWRQEIDDSKATLNPDAFQKIHM